MADVAAGTLTKDAPPATVRTPEAGSIVTLPLPVFGRVIRPNTRLWELAMAIGLKTVAAALADANLWVAPDRHTPPFDAQVSKEIADVETPVFLGESFPRTVKSKPR